MNKEFKIACIGNMNNNMFTLVRLLRDKGYDAHLILLNEEKHFLPEADTFSTEYKNYTHDPNWFMKNSATEDWTDVTPEGIKEFLKPFDVLVGCGYAPAFIRYAKLKLDIFLPYGSDLYELPFLKMWFAKNNTINNLYPQLQKEGIENARNVVWSYTKEQERVMEKFNFTGKRHFIYPPIFYTSDFNKKSISKFYPVSTLYPLMKKLREENELLFIQHSRQSWKNPQDEFSNKRNDILIHTFASFVKQTTKKSKLILLEYGIDVEESKKLIVELNLEAHVHWLPKSPRKELFVAISLCDMGIGELGMSFLMYGAVGEFVTMDLPFVHCCRLKDYEGSYPELYPVNHADSEETLLKHFTELAADKNTYLARAAQTTQWFMKYIIEQPLEHITNLIIEGHERPWYKKIFN